MDTSTLAPLRRALLLLALAWALLAVIAGAAVIALLGRAERAANEQRLRDAALALALAAGAEVAPRLPPGWVALRVDSARLPEGAEGLVENTLIFEGSAMAAYVIRLPQGRSAVVAMPQAGFAGSLPARAARVAPGALLLFALALAAAARVLRRLAAPGDLPAPRAADMAHDFNNLLGVVANSARLVERHVAAQPALALPVRATLHAVEAGQRLTQQLQRIAAAGTPPAARAGHCHRPRGTERTPSWPTTT